MPLRITATATARRRRAFVTGLFGLTFCAAVGTVCASTVLPCPARRDRARWAEGAGGGAAGRGGVEVVKRPRRWIEERARRVE